METSTRIVDYHWKERTEGQNSKITSTGSNARAGAIKASFPNGPISCQDVLFPKGFGMKNKSTLH
jgi:hypothetical protein